MDLYPIHLKFDGRAALVVGGGETAAMKIRALVQSGARVRVVGRTLGESATALVRDFGLPWQDREFVPADLDGVWVVVGSSDDPATNRKIFDCARSRNILVNILDDPDHSDFVFPAVLRRGKLIITVSTSGTAPAFASRLRDYLGEMVGEQFGQVLDQLAMLRRQLQARHADAASRRAAWYDILDTHVLPALKRGESPMLADPVEKEDA